MFSPAVSASAQNASRASVSWLTPVRFAVLLAVLLFAGYSTVLLGLQTFVYRDFGYFSYPIAFYFRESFWHGELPLWNPLSCCGVPFLAQWNTQVLYPPALFYLLLPLVWALPVFCLLHLYLGGVGMYFLARRWTGNSFAAAFAGISFAFSGLVLNSLMWPATIAGFGWMPWVVLSVELAWCEGSRWLPLAALVGALQMLTGAVEVILLTWVLLGALCIADAFSRERSPVLTLFRGAFVVVLVAALTAAQLLPFLDLVNVSSRQSNFNAAIWPMPPTGWANFLAPLFLTNESFHGPFLQANQYWTNSYYVGGLTVTLALWGVLRWRNRRVWVLMALTVAGMVLALGNATPVYSWLTEHVRIIGLMRFPIKFVILPVFALPLLAAYALGKKEERPAGKSWWLMIAVTAMCLLVLAWLCWSWSATPHDARNTALNTLIRAGIFGVLASLLAVRIRGVSLCLSSASQLVFLTLVWWDVSNHGPLPKTVSPNIYQPTLPRSWAAPRFGEGRVALSHEAVVGFNNSVIPKNDMDYVSRRFALFNNCNLMEGISKPDGFFPLRLRDQELFSQILADEQPPAVSEPLLNFLGVKQITMPGDIFSWQARTNPMPLITGGQRPIIAGEADTLKQFTSGNFNPRTEVYLLRDATSFVAFTNSTTVIFTNTAFSASRITTTARAAAPAVVVVAQTFHHNWRAFVDGEPAPLLRANLAFQVVPITAGEHRLELVYVDRKFKLGSVVSLAALAACAGLWAGYGRQKKFNHE